MYSVSLISWEIKIIPNQDNILCKKHSQKFNRVTVHGLFNDTEWWLADTIGVNRNWCTLKKSCFV